VQPAKQRAIFRSKPPSSRHQKKSRSRDSATPSRLKKLAKECKALQRECVANAAACESVTTYCDPASDTPGDTGRSIVDSAIDISAKQVAQASKPTPGNDGQLSSAHISAQLRTARAKLQLLLSASDDPAPDSLSEPPCTSADFQQARNYLRLILSRKPGASAGTLQRTIHRRAKLKNAFTDLADQVRTCTCTCGYQMFMLQQHQKQQQPRTTICNTLLEPAVARRHQRTTKHRVWQAACNVFCDANLQPVPCACPWKVTPTRA
jgi:hypothetical protein